MKRVRTTNPQRTELIWLLRKQSRENSVSIWREIARHLSGPRRRYTTVNLSRLSRDSKKNEVIVVPGKVLSAGEIDHPITVAAFAFSEKAKEKVVAARGKCLTFSELVKKNPKGSNIKIIG